MERGTFIKQSSLVAVGLAAFGKISWSNNGFVGDSPTTTYILGPYYRPGAPLRTDLNPANYSGEVLRRRRQPALIGWRRRHMALSGCLRWRLDPTPITAESMLIGLAQ